MESEESKKALQQKCENARELINAMKSEVRKATRELEKTILDTQFAISAKENVENEVFLGEELKQVN